MSPPPRPDQSPHPRKARDLAIVAAGYACAAAAAYACVVRLDYHPLLTVLIADVLATAVIFAFSVVFRNSSWYDAYWSVAPPLIALWLASLADHADPARTVLVLTVVTLWAIRLTANWAWGWQGMGDEDWRYRDLKSRSGRLWWPLSFLGIHLFPTLVVFLGCLPLYPALVLGTAAPGWLDAVAVALGLSSVWLEFEADRQLHAFRAQRSSRAEILSRGVWRCCRHPNYLGEIGFWVSLFLFGWSALGGIYPWSWLGPAAMVALFTGISIPMIERRLLADKPGYAAYRKRTFALLPIPRF